MRRTTQIVFCFLLAIVSSLNMVAQVTTSSISGTVKAASGEVLAGATIKAVHQPTGTVYVTQSTKTGGFNIVNMIPGGPYKIDISYVGYSAFSDPNITLSLGENTRIDAALQSGATLENVVVTGSRSGLNNRKKTGASTSISRAQINALPTLSRSIADYTRFTPQANGNSFGGASNRFNNITIDGAVNNDVFGLASSGTPGGQASTQPISLDAIQEIQVVLAPYDISYGNFTGGGINAVTRSGTNNLEGSVYGFLRNENTIGKDPVSRVKSTDFSDKQYGLRLGGAIIKNKLFFFVNGELARRTAPTIFNVGDPGALLSVKDAKTLDSFLQAKYKYDPGTSAAYDAQTQSDKLFARIDWNINDKHHLTVRHNYIKAFDDNISRSTTLFRYGNNTYRFNNKQNITVAELRSRFSSAVSNDLIIGRHEIRDFRSTFGQLFPQAEITYGVGGTIQIGSERSSTANELDQDIFEVTDNLKLFKGKHTITFGTHNEFFKFRNLFINNLYGRWQFASLNDFLNNNPRTFAVSYSADKNNPKPAAAFKAMQLGFYAQDEVQFNDRFRLTYGVRVDIPIVSTKPGYNKSVDSTFGSQYRTDNTPSGQVLLSPRVGFNYDVEGDRSKIVRGGIGIFSGRSPFVWLSNQYGGTGLLLKTTSQTTPNVNNGQGFNPDPNAQSSIGVGNAVPTFETNLIDKKFKLPQVLRANLALDAKIPGGVNATFEGIYSKTLNNVFYTDINLKPAVGVADPAYNNGFDKRIAYGTSTAARRINNNITNALLLSNTSKGYTFNLGATFNRTWKHVFAQVAYNYNLADDVNSGASSTALSNWQFVQVVGDPNNPQLATSNYQLTHRITAILSFNFDYAKNFRTSVGFFYSGNSGQVFTYLVNGDLNSDGNFGNDLLYVPADPSQIKFVDFLNSDNTVRYTAAQQSAAFEEFIKNDKYLSKNRGKYVERNGRATPWEHVVDAKVAQDFFIMTGGKRHTLELTFDVFNLTNLLNKDWGRTYSVGNQASSILATVNRTSGAFAGKGYNFNIAAAPWSMNFGSRWQGQVGLRYSFN